MIIVKGIDTIIVEKDEWELKSYTRPLVPIVIDGKPDLMDISYVTQYIRGRRFKRPSDGTDMVIGFSKEAEDILGLTYEVWENAIKELDKMSSSLNKVNKKLDKIMSASFWERFKWIFKGVSYK